MALVLAPFTHARSDIAVTEDWKSPLPTFLSADGAPYDLTGCAIEIYVRPVYNHDTLIAYLSTAGGEIQIDDAAAGYASMNMSRVNVIAIFPIGKWEHFCVLTDVDGNIIEVFRDDFHVHAGRIDL